MGPGSRAFALDRDDTVLMLLQASAKEVTKDKACHDDLRERE
jgi:hypothetical protein